MLKRERGLRFWVWGRWREDEGEKAQGSVFSVLAAGVLGEEETDGQKKTLVMW